MYRTMDSQLLDIDCTKLVHVLPVDSPSFRFYPAEILQAPCLGQEFEDLLLHFVDVLRRVPFPGHYSSDLHLTSVQPAKIAVIGTCAIAHGQEGDPVVGFDILEIRSGSAVRHYAFIELREHLLVEKLNLYPSPIHVNVRQNENQQNSTADWMQSEQSNRRAKSMQDIKPDPTTSNDRLGP